MSQGISRDTVLECRKRLLQIKEELLNRFRNVHFEFKQTEKGTGDEVDQAVASVSENQFLVNQDRLRRQLMEVEMALGRIEMGEFGICEETLEPIEAERLLALPYTRLSIEGAEIREALNRRFAR